MNYQEHIDRLCKDVEPGQPEEIILNREDVELILRELKLMNDSDSINYGIKKIGINTRNKRVYTYQLIGTTIGVPYTESGKINEQLYLYIQKSGREKKLEELGV